MKKTDWQAGLQAILPVCVSYIPIGVACGVLLQQAGFSSLAVLLTSLLIYGGASQFMIASMTLAGTGLWEIVIMVFFINLRHILMSSSLADKVRNRSNRFNALFAQLITDESFAINTMQFKLNPEWTSNRALVSGLAAYLTWGGSTFVGAIIGSNISFSIVVMNYMLTAMFIYLLVSQMENKTLAWTALFAVVASVVLKLVLNNGVSVLLSSILASLFGLSLEMKKERKEEQTVHES